LKTSPANKFSEPEKELFLLVISFLDMFGAKTDAALAQAMVFVAIALVTYAAARCLYDWLVRGHSVFRVKGEKTPGALPC
jgi:hypothetical protein